MADRKPVEFRGSSLDDLRAFRALRGTKQDIKSIGYSKVPGGRLEADVNRRRRCTGG